MPMPSVDARGSAVFHVSQFARAGRAHLGGKMMEMPMNTVYDATRFYESGRARRNRSVGRNG